MRPIIVVCALVVVVGASLANLPPTVNCPSVVQPNSQASVLAPWKVIARPWFGRHQVYALFPVPVKYEPSRYSAELVFRDRVIPVELVPRSGTVHGTRLPDQPGVFFVHTHLETRFVWKILLLGQFGDVREPCQWRLILRSNELPRRDLRGRSHER